LKSCAGSIPAASTFGSTKKAVFRSGVFAGIATIETVVRAVRRDSFELLLEIRRDAWISRGLNGAWHRY
jgi:hypothetical protein